MSGTLPRLSAETRATNRLGILRQVWMGHSPFTLQSTPSSLRSFQCGRGPFLLFSKGGKSTRPDISSASTRDRVYVLQTLLSAGPSYHPRFSSPVCWGGCDCIFKRGGKNQSKEKSARVKAVIREEFNKLGPISYAEGVILFFFIILVILWITRDLGGSGGWGDVFRKGYVSDSTPAILIAILMFVLPSRLPDIFFKSKRDEANARGVLSPLLDWKTLHEKMPWSLYWLLGGGFAIAEAAQESGLSMWLGQKLAVFGSLDPWLVLLIICYIVTFATEVTSNTAIATLMMPILHQLALTLNVNPLFFMFPCAITSSFAFMLPVATPPNAIVFSYGTLRVVDMALCGLVTNLVSVPILLLATVTWGNAFFHFTELPPEFLVNSTVTVSAVA